jgi:hypothetical protein
MLLQVSIFKIKDPEALFSFYNEKLQIYFFKDQDTTYRMREYLQTAHMIGC